MASSSEVKYFSAKVGNKFKVSLRIVAHLSDTNFKSGVGITNLGYKDISGISGPIREMLELLMEVNSWLSNIRSKKILNIDINGDIFLAYFVVKNFLLSGYEVVDSRFSSPLLLNNSAEFIFQQFEDFVKETLESKFKKFPDSFSSCNKCSTIKNFTSLSDNAKISVIIPTKGVTSLVLEQLLTEVSNQLDLRDEIILVDDNDELKLFHDDLKLQFRKLKIIYGDKTGIANARNLGVRASCGELVSFVDSDDYIEKGFFTIQRKLHLRFPNVSATGVWIRAFGNHNKVYPQWDNFNPLSMIMCLPAAGVLMWKREAIIDLNYFKPDFSTGFEDFDLVSRATVMNHTIITLDSILYNYQRGHVSLSQTWSRDQEKINRSKVLINSKLLCEHKYLVLLELLERYGQKLNYSSLDLIFNSVYYDNRFGVFVKKYRNNKFALRIWLFTPVLIKKYILKKYN